MKGNVFSDWLKEFCALVFTQTVQAFILAIILTLVVTALFTDSGYSNVTQNQAAGVLAIIALTSISKMESLVKKLFGLNSSITDTSMKGGRGGVLGSIAAMKMAKNVLNNVPKIGQGISDWRKGGRAAKQAKIDAYDRLEKLNRRYGIGENGVNSNSNTPNGGDNNGNGSSNPTNNLPRDSSGNPLLTGAENGGRVASDSIDGSSSTTQSTNKSNDKYLDKKEKIMEEYQKKMSEAKQLRSGSYKKVASGMLETAKATQGAVLGLATGAVVGASTGEDILSYATKGTGIGMGIGDKIGKGIADAAFVPKDMAKAVSHTMKLYNAENRRKIEKFEEELKKFNAGDI